MTITALACSANAGSVSENHEHALAARTALEHEQRVALNRDALHVDAKVELRTLCELAALDGVRDQPRALGVAARRVVNDDVQPRCFARAQVREHNRVPRSDHARAPR